MDKGILKMVAIVTIVAITLLIGSICLAMRYGGFMMSSVTSSDETNQNSGTVTSDSSSPSGQKK